AVADARAPRRAAGGARSGPRHRAWELGGRSSRNSSGRPEGLSIVRRAGRLVGTLLARSWPARDLPGRRGAHTKRHDTDPMRVKLARTASPALGRNTLAIEPVSTMSRAQKRPPRRPRALASQASEFSGLPITSAAAAVAIRWPFSS